MVDRDMSGRGVPGLLGGAGLLLLTPLFAPGVAAVSRPVMKSVIKGAMATAGWMGPATSAAAQWLGEVTEETREQLGDIVAEARQERVSRRTRATRATRPAAAATRPAATAARARRGRARPAAA